MNRVGLSVEETQMSSIQLSFEYIYSPETSMMGAPTGRLDIWNMPLENKLVQTVKNILKQWATNQSLGKTEHLSNSNSPISNFFVSSAISALCEQDFFVSIVC